MESEQELKYKAALDVIADGSSWEAFIAKSALSRKHGLVHRTLAFLGDNLAAIASLVIAASGIWFGIMQYQTNQSQKAAEIKMAKVDALQKLVPSLTSESGNARKYGLAALLSLAQTFDKSELKSLAMSVGDIGDPDTLEPLAKQLNDPELKAKAAEFYALRAEKSRHDANKLAADDEKAKPYLDIAWSDTQRALGLDPENARAVYQHGVLLMDMRKDFSQAYKEFAKVITLIEAKKYPPDSNLYLRSFLYQTRCEYESSAKKMTEAVCATFKTTKARYEQAKETLDLKGEELQPFEAACR
jgi:hypothetical protein